MRRKRTADAPPPPSPSTALPTLSYTPTLMDAPVSGALQAWVQRAMGRQWTVMAREAGGGGDCFYHSVAAALELV